jgi:anti-sigma regulatory factor (Ser/Thr protein kinase)
MTDARREVRADAIAPAILGRFLEAFLRDHGIADDDVARFMIALEELVSNLVKYGYTDDASRGAVAMRLALAGGWLRVELVDDGRPFDPFEQPPPDLDATLEARPVGGLGLHLVKQMMEETGHRRRDGRNITTFGRRVLSGPSRAPT